MFARRLARSPRPTSLAPTVAIEQLEKRELLATSPVVAGAKIKGINLSSGGVSTNQTLVTIPFSGDVNLLDASKIRMFGYAINPLSSKLGQVKKTINITNANVLALDVNADGVVDHQLLQFTTDRLARKGATIILNSGALEDTGHNLLAAQTLHTVKGQNRERFTLANRAFIPTDFTRFTQDIFAASPNPAAAGNTIDEATATAALQAFLDKKVALGLIDSAKETATMTRFSSAAAKGTIPDHNLRAALFSLVGTFAEGAIASWLDGANVTGKPYTIITFQTPNNPDVPVAETSARPSDGRLRTVFQPEFKGESFIALSDYVAHEALHQDNVFTLQEETAATTFGHLIAAQQAQVDSSFLKTPTKLVNGINDALLALLNSGRTIFPYVGVKQAPMLGAANGVFKGQAAASDGGGLYTSFDDFIRRSYLQRGSPAGNAAGNALLNQYYTTVTGKTATANMQFSDQIITDIDAFQTPVGTHGAIVLAQALRLSLS
jgi:hypothetical protein